MADTTVTPYWPPQWSYWKRVTWTLGRVWGHYRFRQSLAKFEQNPWLQRHLAQRSR